ncbi:hypothetical protein ACHAXT_000125 [Thalassiosira profunda]
MTNEPNDPAAPPGEDVKDVPEATLEVEDDVAPVPFEDSLDDPQDAVPQEPRRRSKLVKGLSAMGLSTVARRFDRRGQGELDEAEQRARDLADTQGHVRPDQAITAMELGMANEKKLTKAVRHVRLLSVLAFVFFVGLFVAVFFASDNAVAKGNVEVKQKIDESVQTDVAVDALGDPHLTDKATGKDVTVKADGVVAGTTPRVLNGRKLTCISMVDVAKAVGGLATAATKVNLVFHDEEGTETEITPLLDYKDEQSFLSFDGGRIKILLDSDACDSAATLDDGVEGVRRLGQVAISTSRPGAKGEGIQAKLRHAFVSARTALREGRRLDSNVEVEVTVDGTYGNWCASKCPAPYHLVGCYKDDTRNRDFPATIAMFTDDVTQDTCHEACRNLGYKYFGLQGNDWGESECFCGNNPGSHGEATGCDCSWGPTNFGSDKNCVYTIRSKLTLDPCDIGEVGLYFPDEDRDGYGNKTAVPKSCIRPWHVLNNQDCDDADRSVNPGAQEVCGDGIDNDCDGKFLDPSTEVCDGLDNDCDGNTDEGTMPCEFSCSGSIPMPGWHLLSGTMPPPLPFYYSAEITTALASSRASTFATGATEAAGSCTWSLGDAAAGPSTVGDAPSSGLSSVAASFAASAASNSCTLASRSWKWSVRSFNGDPAASIRSVARCSSPSNAAIRSRARSSSPSFVATSSHPACNEAWKASFSSPILACSTFISARAASLAVRSSSAIFSDAATAAARLASHSSVAFFISAPSRSFSSVNRLASSTAASVSVRSASRAASFSASAAWNFLASSSDCFVSSSMRAFFTVMAEGINLAALCSMVSWSPAISACLATRRDWRASSSDCLAVRADWRVGTSSMGVPPFRWRMDFTSMSLGVGLTAVGSASASPSSLTGSCFASSAGLSTAAVSRAGAWYRSGLASKTRSTNPPNPSVHEATCLVTSLPTASAFRATSSTCRPSTPSHWTGATTMSLRRNKRTQTSEYVPATE